MTLLCYDVNDDDGIRTRTSQSIPTIQTFKSYATPYPDEPSGPKGYGSLFGETQVICFVIRRELIHVSKLINYN